MNSNSYKNSNIQLSSFLYHLAIWFDILALVLISDDNFIIAKLKIWAWCGAAIMKRRIIYVFTNAC